MGLGNFEKTHGLKNYRLLQTFPKSVHGIYNLLKGGWTMYMYMYRRTGFKCENLIIANYKCLLRLQLLEMQLYPIYSPPCEPCARQMLLLNMQFCF